jgi:polar amino acid transport system substrate-binding protein
MMNRKMTGRLAAAAVMLAALVSAPAFAGETLDRVMKSGELVGASTDGYPPVAFLNDKNEFDGFDVEVLRAIAGKLGVKTRIVTPSWEAQVAGRWAGRWDIAVGSMTPTRERAEVLDFPAIYYYTPAAVAVHKDETDVKTVDDLAGKVIGSCSACSYEDYLRKSLNMDAIGTPKFDYIKGDYEIRTYESDGLAFDDLRLGAGKRLDAVLTNLPTLKEAIDNGYPFRILTPPVFFEPLAVAVDKGDPEFTARIKEIVEGLKADGTLAQLSVKWFGVDLTKAQ